ncbi:hypothetical protein EG835_09960, partial [bacterium]|nr:hypothetical protein [bacterium]
NSGILEEYDASIPSDLDFVAEHGLPGGAPSVSVDGDIAYVGLTDPEWGGSGAKVFDVSTPGELSYFQYYSLGDRVATDLSALDGQLASVGEGGVLLTGTYEPTLPYALGSMPMPGARVDQLGDLIAVTNPGGGTTFMRYNPISFRTFGGDRFDTAIAMSQTFDSSEYVVLATGRSYPDALAGVPLAYALNAPILLTEATSIPPEVADEIERLGATKAIVLGGTSAMSDAIITQLRSMGFAAVNIERISGATRYETAKAIAFRLERVVGDGQIDKVFVATGKNFPDALAAAGAAAKAGCPILLVKPGDSNAAALTAIAALGATDAVIVGGTAVVPADIASRLPSPERLWGANRYETAVDIADWSMADPDTAFSASNLFVVTGLNFPDALSSGVVAAGSGAPTLLVGQDPSPATLGFV